MIKGLLVLGVILIWFLPTFDTAGEFGVAFPFTVLTAA